MTEKYPLPRRVLMTADTVGGVATCALELARSRGECGVEVALATLGAPTNELQREKVDRIPNLRVFEGHFKLEWMDDPWRDVEKSGDWLLNLERRICPDVVHLNGYTHGALPWGSPTVIVGHSDVLSWWRAVRREEAPEAYDRYRREVAAGALVLGDIPGLREVWRSRAVFVPADDPEALERAILDLIEQPDRRQSLAAGAHKRALEYTPERMVEGYLAAYGQVLAGREQ